MFPDTKPGVTIGEDGVCSACKSVELKKKIDWKQRHLQLKQLCDDIKGSNGYSYDCIVPVSGGKDSIYQLHTMKYTYGLKVLAVHVSPHIHTPEGINNINSMVENLDIDFIKVSVRPSTHKKIRKMAFVEVGNLIMQSIE